MASIILCLILYLSANSSNDYWIEKLGLFENDRNVLLSSQWLNDNIIYVAQQLMKMSVPDGSTIGGLQSPQCGRVCGFKPAKTREKWIQLFHVNGDHWITVSNIDVGQDAARSDVVYVYDSLLQPGMSLNTKKMICSLARPVCKTVTFDIINVMSQPNTWDCGVFALANATELLYGYDPARCHWEVGGMRKHLLECLERGHMLRFPTLKQRRLPLGSRVKFSFKESIYCVCRMPNDKKIPMVQCSSCTNWYHGQCLNINVEDVEASERKWICDECKEMLSDNCA